MQPLRVRGFEIYKACLDASKQAALVEELRGVLAIAPLVRPVTPSGREMSVRMSAAGRLGWITDRNGYRYSKTHPNGACWPPMPGAVLNLWHTLVDTCRDPDCCLINWYGEDARMGLHQDRDEGNFDWPVLSVSLGDAALFRMGGPERGGKTQSVWLESGDVVLMGGAARLAFHGVDRVRHGSSTLLPRGGRINLTLRVVEL